MTRQGVDGATVLRLGDGTPADEVKRRKGPGGTTLDYVDARFVMDRLDLIVGVENWRDEYQVQPDGSVLCGIGVLVDGEWVVKWDVGVRSDIEPELGAVSHAFKRAAVKWGIARDLYGHKAATTQATAGHSSPAAAPSPVPAAGRAPARPAPAGDPDHCPVHGDAWVHKTGVGRQSGKPYDFWTCPAKVGEGWCRKSPEDGWRPPEPTARDEEDDLDALPF